MLCVRPYRTSWEKWLNLVGMLIARKTCFFYAMDFNIDCSRETPSPIMTVMQSGVSPCGDWFLNSVPSWNFRSIGSNILTLDPWGSQRCPLSPRVESHTAGESRGPKWERKWEQMVRCDVGDHWDQVGPGWEVLWKVFRCKGPGRWGRCLFMMTSYWNSSRRVSISNTFPNLSHLASQKCSFSNASMSSWPSAWLETCKILKTKE